MSGRDGEGWEAKGQGQVRDKTQEEGGTDPSSPRGAETRSRPRAGPGGSPTLAGAAAHPHRAPQDPPGARPARSPPAPRGAGCRRGGGAPLPGASGQVGSIMWKQSHILAAGRCWPAAARRVQSQIPAPPRGRPGCGRAQRSASAALRCRWLQAADCGQSPRPQPRCRQDPARASPARAQPLRSERGRSRRPHSAHWLLSARPRPLVATPRPCPAGNRLDPGPAH